MNSVTQKINNTINHYIKKNNFKNILLCVSGGVDSIVLFHSVLKSSQQLNFYFSMCYFNHKVRKKSNLDESLCINIAKEYNIKLYKGSLSINFELKKNETNLRTERYNFINKIYKNNNFDSIFTAHHLDDQIETYLMRKSQTNDDLILTGIRKKNNYLYRPFLEISKDEIYSYANSNNITWNEDETNKNITYLRNSIRNSLIPNLIVKDFDFKNKIIDEINISKSKAELIKKKVSLFFKSNVVFENKKFFVNKNCLLNENPFTIKYILKKIVSNFKGNDLFFSKKHLANFIVFLKKRENNIIFQISKNVNIFKYFDQLIVYQKSRIIKKNIKITNEITNWNFHNIKVVKDININMNYYNFFEINKDELKSGLYIRSWNNNDSIVFNNNGNKKKIKKILSEEKIIPLFRKEIPIIVNSNNDVLWIPGIKKIYCKNNSTYEKKYLLWQKN